MIEFFFAYSIVAHLKKPLVKIAVKLLEIVDFSIQLVVHVSNVMMIKTVISLNTAVIHCKQTLQHKHIKIYCIARSLNTFRTINPFYAIGQPNFIWTSKADVINFDMEFCEILLLQRFQVNIYAAKLQNIKWRYFNEWKYGPKMKGDKETLTHIQTKHKRFSDFKIPTSISWLFVQIWYRSFSFEQSQCVDSLKNEAQIPERKTNNCLLWCLS